MKKIIYTRPDGGISIVSPAPKARVGLVLPQVLSMTDDEYLEFIKNKDVPQDAVEVHIVDETDIPTDRTHRNEWKFDSVDKKVKEDSVKVQAKLDKIATEKAKEDALITKLKITKEDFDVLKRKLK